MALEEPKNNGSSQKNGEKKKEEGEKKKKLNIYKHKDPTTGLTMKKLERSLWFFEHRSHFQKSVIIILILISALSWGYVTYYTTMYLYSGMEKDDRMIRGITTNLLPGHEYTLEISPKPLMISQIKTFDNQDKFDIIALVENPNPWHYAYFNYCFTTGPNEINCDQSFIFPEESKYIVNTGDEADYGYSNINFNIERVNWKKINRHEIMHWEPFREDRLNIKFQDKEFLPPGSSELSEKLNISVLKFDAINNTSYSYYRMPLNIFLYRGNRIVGVNRYVLRNFRSQEETSLSLTLPNVTYNVDEIRIVPDVDIMSEESYIFPGR